MAETTLQFVFLLKMSVPLVTPELSTSPTDLSGLSATAVLAGQIWEYDAVVANLGENPADVLLSKTPLIISGDTEPHAEP